jgi:hypothetical protein
MMISRHFVLFHSPQKSRAKLGDLGLKYLVEMSEAPVPHGKKMSSTILPTLALLCVHPMSFLKTVDAQVLVQLVWAVTSALLTIYLTSSTSFVTRKDSGVLGPLFADDGADTKAAPSQPERKRKVMYYVRQSVQS